MCGGAGFDFHLVMSVAMQVYYSILHHFVVIKYTTQRKKQQEFEPCKEECYHVFHGSDISVYLKQNFEDALVIFFTVVCFF
jgi:hypothetical protein